MAKEFPRPSKRRVIAAIAAVGLVPFGVAAVGHLPTSDATSTVQAGTVTPGASAGWIALQTGSTSRVTLWTDEGLRATQTLASASACGVNQGAAASRLLTLRGSTGSTFSESLASYATGSVGVKEKKSGTSCSQVNSPVESLQLSVGAAASTELGVAVVASSAYLDVELKQSAVILATATRAGEDDVLFELQSGDSVSGAPINAGVDPDNVATCENGADSGPDSTVGDNCRWAISAPSWMDGGDDGVSFETLTLKAVQGAFSLEGGSDGAVLPAAGVEPTNASIVELVNGYEGTLACGDTTEEENGFGTSPTVKIYRLDNIGTTTCTGVAYSLSNGEYVARFLKPLDDQPTAQFVWDLKWKLPHTAGTTVLEDLTIDYETPIVGGVQTLGWCPDSTYKNAEPFFDGYDATQLANNVLLPDQDEYANKQFACVIKREATAKDGGTSGTTADDYLEVRDLVYVLGDAALRGN